MGLVHALLSKVTSSIINKHHDSLKFEPSKEERESSERRNFRRREEKEGHRAAITEVYVVGPPPHFSLLSGTLCGSSVFHPRFTQQHGQNDGGHLT